MGHASPFAFVPDLRELFCGAAAASRVPAPERHDAVKHTVELTIDPDKDTYVGTVSIAVELTSRPISLGERQGCGSHRGSVKYQELPSRGGSRP